MNYRNLIDNIFWLTTTFFIILLVAEAILLPAWIGIYFDNKLISIVCFIAIVSLFFIEQTTRYISFFFAFVASLIPIKIVSLFHEKGFLETVKEQGSDPLIITLSLTIFIAALFYNTNLYEILKEIFNLGPRQNLREVSVSQVSDNHNSDKLAPPSSNDYKNEGNIDEVDKEVDKQKISIKRDSINFIDNGKVDPLYLREFLEKEGFGLLQESEDRNARKALILMDDGIIKVYGLHELKRWISKKIDHALVGRETINAWLKFSDNNLKKSVVDHLSVYSTRKFANTKEIKILEDTQDACFLKFQNGILKITKHDYQFLMYQDINGFIWETSIIQRSFEGFSRLNDNKSKTSRDLFKAFVKKSTLSRKAQLNSGNWKDDYCNDEISHKTLLGLKTGLGYLMHGYNDPSRSKAVLFVDRFSKSGKAEGGTGKSLILSSLSFMIKQAVLDGKKFIDNPLGGRFQFAGITSRTKNIFIDDLRPDFKPEALFTMITGDIEVEKKGENKFIIPSHQKPKIALTTNYPILNRDTSFTRRIHQIQLGEYWNRAIKEGIVPHEELGCRLFGDAFDQDDWDDFYIFISECVSCYLENGLVHGELDFI